MADLGRALTEVMLGRHESFAAGLLGACGLEVVVTSRRNPEPAVLDYALRPLARRLLLQLVRDIASLAGVKGPTGWASAGIQSWVRGAVQALRADDPELAGLPSVVKELHAALFGAPSIVTLTVAGGDLKAGVITLQVVPVAEIVPLAQRRPKTKPELVVAALATHSWVDGDGDGGRVGPSHRVF